MADLEEPMTATFYVGDAVTVMNTLHEKSVDLILTSPPFLALRSYLPADHPDKILEGGSQATPGEYVDWLLDVVEACARVLAPHGSLCFELGDTYSAEPNQRYADNDGNLDKSRWLKGNRDGGAARPPSGGGTGWPLAKSLSLIPETFRFAMVYGHNPHTGRTTPPWRLRNVIRWVRPNPPVGALGDKFRPATSELMVFCKAKDRFFDLDAVREPHKWPNAGPLRSRAEGTKGALHEGTDTGKTWDSGERMVLNPVGAPPLDWWDVSLNPADAPPLDWWNIPPGGYPGAHYAVWPPELLVKPIKAMCPEKVCRRCGEASRRIVEHERSFAAVSDGAGLSVAALGRGGPMGTTYEVRRDTLGFSDCGHNDYRPGLVLDPFAGSGTTLAVATGHGRDAIGIDIDERNYELALDRVGPLVLTRAA